MWKEAKHRLSLETVNLMQSNAIKRNILKYIGKILNTYLFFILFYLNKFNLVYLV